MSVPHPSHAGEADLPRVAVVLVNWRAAAMTLEAVRRALDQSLPPARIHVVDNGSGDGSVEMLRAALPPDDRVVLHDSPHNAGFGSGCNIALRAILDAADISHVWLLNNDAVPAPDCLARLVEAAVEANFPIGSPPVGIVGSLLVDPTGDAPAHFGSWLNPVTLTCGAVSPSDPPDRHALGWLTAASMLVSIPALQAAGLFDESFFMYWEDADLNLRIRRAGFRTIGAADAVVEHHAGTSSVTIPVQRYLWHLASQDRFLTKHHPSPRIGRISLRAKYLLKALIDRDLPRFRALARAAAVLTAGGTIPA